MSVVRLAVPETKRQRRQRHGRERQKRFERRRRDGLGIVRVEYGDQDIELLKLNHYLTEASCDDPVAIGEAISRLISDNTVRLTQACLALTWSGQMPMSNPGQTSTRHSMNAPIPFRPVPSARSESIVSAVVRAATAMVRARNLHEARRGLVNDKPALAFLERAATVPASLAAGPSQFLHTTIETLISILGGASAAGAIIDRATQLSFGDANQVWCPGIAADATNVGFVAEGSPLRVRQFDLSAGVNLIPTKLGFICVLSNELISHSNAEALIRRRMVEDLRLGIETLMFDTTAGSTTRPPGLRYNIAAIGASSDTGIVGMTADVAAVCSAVAGVAGLSDVLSRICKRCLGGPRHCLAQLRQSTRMRCEAQARRPLPAGRST